jgi:hypothetical protein
MANDYVDKQVDLFLEKYRNQSNKHGLEFLGGCCVVDMPGTNEVVAIDINSRGDKTKVTLYESMSDEQRKHLIHAKYRPR